MKKTDLKTKKFKFTLKGVGNPDFRQYADVCEKLQGEGTLKEIREASLKYIEDNNLGSGNFVCKIHGSDYCISYNGRVWKGKILGVDTIEIPLSDL